MKTIITTTLLATGLLLTGFNVIEGKKIPQAKEEIRLPAVPSRIYVPAPTAPSCPSSEFQVVLLNRSAEGQTEGMHTIHCAKCSLGALYKQGEVYICSYCESKF